jgi:hypothetical protein
MFEKSVNFRLRHCQFGNAANAVLLGRADIHARTRTICLFRGALAHGK